MCFSWSWYLFSAIEELNCLSTKVWDAYRLYISKAHCLISGYLVAGWLVVISRTKDAVKSQDLFCAYMKNSFHLVKGSCEVSSGLCPVLRPQMLLQKSGTIHLAWRKSRATFPSTSFLLWCMLFSLAKEHKITILIVVFEAVVYSSLPFYSVTAVVKPMRPSGILCCLSKKMTWLFSPTHLFYYVLAGR